MKIKDIIDQLTKFDPDSDVAIYDDDNDRVLDIGAIDEDDADEENPPRVFIFC